MKNRTIIIMLLILGFSAFSQKALCCGESSKKSEKMVNQFIKMGWEITSCESDYYYLHIKTENFSKAWLAVSTIPETQMISFLESAREILSGYKYLAADIEIQGGKLDSFSLCLCHADYCASDYFTIDMMRINYYRGDMRSSAMKNIKVSRKVSGKYSEDYNIFFPRTSSFVSLHFYNVGGNNQILAAFGISPQYQYKYVGRKKD